MNSHENEKNRKVPTLRAVSNESTDSETTEEVDNI